MDKFDNTTEYLDMLEKYKMIAENTVECIWILDLSNRCFKYISPSIFTLRGLTVEEAMKEKLEDCLTPESLQKIKSQKFSRLAKFLAGDMSENIASSIDEFDQYCKDGSIKTIEISTKLILNTETNTIDVLGVSRDVSYRKKLSEKELSLQNNSFSDVRPLLGIDMGRVYFFSKLSVYGNSSNSPIKWRTSKSEELFAFLVANRELEISKWKICETLWPESNPETVVNLLHTTLYKMKQTLKSADINFEIKFINSCYWFSIPNVYIDIEDFNSTLSSTIVITENTIEKYKNTFLLYTGNYLEENDYAWSLSLKETMSIKYSKLSKALINYFMKKSEYTEAEKIITSYLEKNPLDEFANEMCLKLYFSRNDRISFINHYKLIKKLFKEELGIEPTPKIQELYTTISK